MDGSSSHPPGLRSSAPARMSNLGAVAPTEPQVSHFIPMSRRGEEGYVQIRENDRERGRGM